MPTNPAHQIQWPALEESVCRAVACIELIAEKLTMHIEDQTNKSDPQRLVATGIILLAANAVTDLVKEFETAAAADNARKAAIREAEAARPLRSK